MDGDEVGDVSKVFLAREIPLKLNIFVTPILRLTGRNIIVRQPIYVLFAAVQILLASLKAAANTCWWFNS